MADYTDFYIQWHITNRCNNRCKHCYHDNYDYNGELTQDDLLRVLDNIEDAMSKWGFTTSMSLTGGEPFTRSEELFSIMDKIETCKHIVDYDILSNGKLINQSIIDKLHSFKKLRRIQVSLEGSCEELHDTIRGKGDFKDVTNAIKLLKDNGFLVSVMTTLTQNNKNDIENIIQLLKRLKVDYFAIERFVPEGQGKENNSWVLTKDELKEKFDYLTKRAFEEKEIHILLYRALFCLCKDDATVGAMCSAGNNALAILPDATILPCRRLPIPIGNVLKNGIIDTWYNSPLLWELRDVNNYKGKCKECEHFFNCRGCRSVAYAMTGDYMQEDPQCWK